MATLHDFAALSPEAESGIIMGMQALIEMLAGLIALLAAAALSQFGVDLNAPPKPDREIQRVQECGDNKPATKVHVTAPASC